jgi:hypothetical protein
MRAILKEVKVFVNRTHGLKVSEVTDTSIRLENERLYWRKGFEKSIRAFIESNNLDLLCSTSFGGYDYLIVKKGSL